MPLWLNRSGGHWEYEAKFLQDGRIHLTWNGLNRDLGVNRSREDLQAILGEVYP